MEYIRAAKEDTDRVYRLVQETIAAVYPKYYPKAVVDFFSRHHSREKIAADIEQGLVEILVVNHQLVGTGSHEENHITRVFVLPSFQKQGYGSCIMKRLEDEISRKYDSVYLDASLSASRLYEGRGYQTVKHERLEVENGAVLVYEIMEKKLRA